MLAEVYGWPPDVVMRMTPAQTIIYQRAIEDRAVRSTGGGIDPRTGRRFVVGGDFAAAQRNER